MGFNWGAAAAGLGVGLVTGNPVAGVMTYESMTAADAATDAQEQANERNVALQREAQTWQERLANSAHQREVLDLKAAGLNPILSTHGGAVTPSVPPARVESTAPTILQGSNQYIGAGSFALRNKLELETLKNQILAQKSQTMLNSAQAVRAGAETQSVMLDNDVKQFLQPYRMKEGYNKLVSEALGHANKAREESMKVQRPFWLQNQLKGFRDFFTGKY